MQSTVAQHAQQLLKKLEATGPSQRYIVGVAGGPGSGKTEFAREVCDDVNSRWSSSHGTEVATVISMDGWHFYRKQLDRFPDPQDAHFRRGAHDTFDAEAFVAFVRSLRDPALAGQTILAPSFDHAVKDPVEDSIHILPEHRIILIEGLYVALSIPPWAAAAEELDERWVLTVEESIARERIAARHLRAGICPTREAALHRADANDLPNGRFLLSNIVQPVNTIESIDDARYIAST